MNNYSHIILKSEYNKNTGVLIDEVKFRKTSKSRGGWKRMYKDYTKYQNECIVGKSDIRIWNYIIENTKADFSVSINVTKIADMIGTTRPTVHRLILRMKEFNVIRKLEDRIYEFNPFIYCPFGASDEVIYEKQLEWKEYLKTHSLADSLNES